MLLFHFLPIWTLKPHILILEGGKRFVALLFTSCWPGHLNPTTKDQLASLFPFGVILASHDLLLEIHDYIRPKKELLGDNAWLKMGLWRSILFHSAHPMLEGERSPDSVQKKCTAPEVQMNQKGRFFKCPSWRHWTPLSSLEYHK